MRLKHLLKKNVSCLKLTMALFSVFLLLIHLANAARVPLIIDTDIGTDFDDT